MTDIQILSFVFSLYGQPVIDIGAGNGIYSRQLQDEGAIVTAVEIDQNKIVKARAELPLKVDVRLGSAEELPVEANSQMLACFFFSLHHIPAEHHETAFDEVYRVLSPCGCLHVVEPYPYGTMFDVVKLVEDETAVRIHSHKVLNKLNDDPRFDLVFKKDYVLTREYPTFEDFLAVIVLPDADRSKIFRAVTDELRGTYERVAETVGGRRVLHQPCAAYHFVVRKSDA